MNQFRSIILTVMRHGQTEGNVHRLCEGITDTPLNDNGRHQAKCAGGWLKYKTFDVVYTSDLKRASETAAIIIEENVNMQKSCDNFMELSMLRERNIGTFEGCPLKECQKAAAKENTPWLQYTPKEAESLDDVKNRVISFMKMLCESPQQSPDKCFHVLVVTHSFVIVQLISYMYEEAKCDGIPLEEVQKVWTNENDGVLLTTIPNTAITRFEIKIDEKTNQMQSAHCTLYKSREHLF